MNRISKYIFIYIITLIIFIYFNSFQIVDTLVFLMFLSSSILFVFSQEELPKQNLLKYPEAKQYYQNRINLYGYTVSGLLIIASLLYVSLTMYFRLNSGAASLIIWPILIILFYSSTIIINRKRKINELVSILRQNINTDENILRDIVKDFLNKKNSYSNTTKSKFINTHKDKLSIPLLHETHKVLTKSLQKQQKNDIFSDEVSEANKTIS